MATLQARKPLVNDVVFSFCYACRHCGAQEYDWVYPIFGTRFRATSGLPDKIEADTFAVFISYALSKQPNYIIAMRQVIHMATWLRNFNQLERAYALELMERYYGTRISVGKIVGADNRAVFC